MTVEFEPCGPAVDFAGTYAALREALGGALFGDPALEILIELLLAQSDGQWRTQTSLAKSVMRSPTTAGRYIDILAARGLVQHGPGGRQAPEGAIQLSREGKILLETVFSQVALRRRTP